MVDRANAGSAGASPSGMQRKRRLGGSLALRTIAGITS